MNPMRKMRLVSCPLATMALACVVSGVQAAPMVLDNVSALDAAQQIGDKYGVNIVFKGDFGPTKYVSFTLPDADAAGARLQAVNALANAVGADFTKTYVISHVAVGQDVPVTKVDSNASVVFQSTTVPAQQAITMVAAVDNATAQFPRAIGGDVTLTATKLDADSAAQEIAAQTHTRWKSFYAMFPRIAGRHLGGKVIGRTNGGSPITELPYVYYQHIPTAAERLAQQKADEQAQQQANAQTGANTPGNVPPGMNNGVPMNGYSPYGDYADPNGNDGYNYADPYGYGGYGNGGYDSGGYGGYPGGYGYGNGGYVSDGSGLVLGTGNAGSGPIIFQGVGY